MLKNKKFIISAAGDGIGLKITESIIEKGGIVYLTDIDEQKKINLAQLLIFHQQLGYLVFLKEHLMLQVSGR